MSSRRKAGRNRRHHGPSLLAALLVTSLRACDPEQHPEKEKRNGGAVVGRRCVARSVIGVQQVLKRFSTGSPTAARINGLLGRAASRGYATARCPSTDFQPLEGGRPQIRAGLSATTVVGREFTVVGAERYTDGAERHSDHAPGPPPN